MEDIQYSVARDWGCIGIDIYWSYAEYMYPLLNSYKAMILSLPIFGLNSLAK